MHDSDIASPGKDRTGLGCGPDRPGFGSNRRGLTDGNVSARSAEPWCVRSCANLTARAITAAPFLSVANRRRSRYCPAHRRGGSRVHSYARGGRSAARRHHSRLCVPRRRRRRGGHLSPAGSRHQAAAWSRTCIEPHRSSTPLGGRTGRIRHLRHRLPRRHAIRQSLAHAVAGPAHAPAAVQQRTGRSHGEPVVREPQEGNRHRRAPSGAPRGSRPVPPPPVCNRTLADEADAATMLILD